MWVSSRPDDEDPSLCEPQRNSVSFLLYLTADDWAADDGGVLRIFEHRSEGEPLQAAEKLNRRANVLSS